GRGGGGGGGGGGGAAGANVEVPKPTMWDSPTETETAPLGTTTAVAVVAQNAELTQEVPRVVPSTAGPDRWDAIRWSQLAGVARWTWSHNSGRPTGNICPLNSSE